MFTVNFFKSEFKFTNKGCVHNKVFIKSVNVKADNSTLAEMIAIADNKDIKWDYVETA